MGFPKRLKLMQPPYSIFGFCNCFCLLQSKKTFVKSSHLLVLFTLPIFDKKKTVFIKMFEANIQGRSNTKNFTKILPYLFSGCDKSIALELERVTQYILDWKKLKNYFMCKSNVIRTLNLFYRHNTTWKNIDTETAIFFN